MRSPTHCSAPTPKPWRSPRGYSCFQIIWASAITCHPLGAAPTRDRRPNCVRSSMNGGETPSGASWARVIGYSVGEKSGARASRGQAGWPIAAFTDRHEIHTLPHRELGVGQSRNAAAGDQCGAGLEDSADPIDVRLRILGILPRVGRHAARGYVEIVFRRYARTFRFKTAFGVNAAITDDLRFLRLLIGVGSRRRSASQAIDLPSDGGVNLERLLTSWNCARCLVYRRE
jgi:hypothetical protein